MLRIVIPMAGRGQRFRDAGYDMPKPLIPVHGLPMIQVVINNLRPRQEHRFIFICQKSHLKETNLGRVLNAAAPGAQLVTSEGITAGAACTVLLAREYIANEDSLMIANCDQWINYSIDRYLSAFDVKHTAGFIMTMTSSQPKWSYIRRNRAGNVVGVVEKQVVSDEATVGIYNFARGMDFVRAAESMIRDDDRTNGEFYVAPTYTRLIKAGGLVESMSVGTDRNGMYGLGTPADLEWFLNREEFRGRVAAKHKSSKAA